MDSTETSSSGSAIELEQAALDVVGTIGKPVDSWAVAATLESLGYRDVDAVDRYRRKDLFELAGDIFGMISSGRVSFAAGTAAASPRGRHGKAARFFRAYLKGAVTAMPMFGQIAAILLLRYSLWAWVDFTETQATVVALGTILSFLVTGGFIQSIGREGIRYLGATNYALSERACWNLVVEGTVVVVVVGGLLFVADILVPVYDLRLMEVSLMYYLLLSELWLYSSVANVLDRPMAIFAITLAGVVPVMVVMEATKLGIYFAHWCGMSFALILMMAYTMPLFRSVAKSTAPELRTTQLPRRAVRAYLIYPYFIYGFFYFLNLFIDRIVSWSTPGAEPPPYLIWFRTSYELGMDWALLSLVLTIAFLEYIIYEFSYYQIPAQKSVDCARRDDYNTFFHRFHRRYLVGVAVIGLVNIAATYFGVVYFRHFSQVKEVREFFSDPRTFFVFYAAAIGYWFLAVGLYNNLFIFTLSRPEFVLKSIIPSTAVNLGVGLIASRWFHYEYGVLGLVAGSATFAFLSTKYARSVFRSLDYYYYSAF